MKYQKKMTPCPQLPPTWLCADWLAAQMHTAATQMVHTYMCMSIYYTAHSRFTAHLPWDGRDEQLASPSCTTQQADSQQHCAHHYWVAAPIDCQEAQVVIG